ncbi:MAG: HlyD family efflux transporter periplasmic adaptor subunit [Nanoarchaeota archaeon]|nr:HlyD family efflux transporter periplasmic adaptor subunit [Nanoarchaeota archaeon]
MVSQKNFFARSHAFVSLAVLGIVLGSAFAYVRDSGEKGGVRYVFAEVTRGTLISSISSTGQVLALQQVEIKPTVSGKVLLTGAKTGEYMKQGTLIARLDPEEAEKAVREAETNLETSRLSLQKLLASPDQLSLLQAENLLSQVKESKKNAEEQIAKSYEDGFNAVSNAFLDLPDVMTGLQDILFSSSIAESGLWNIDFYFSSISEDDSRARVFRDDARNTYDAARLAYDETFAKYKAASRYSSPEEIGRLIEDTYEMTRLVSDAVKSANNFIRLYQDEVLGKGRKPHSISDIHLSSLSGFTGKTNSHLSSLLSAERSISDSEASLLNVERTVEERIIFLQNLKDGPDALDVRSKELEVKQREDALRDAKQTILDYEIRAPFDGVLAKLNAQEGDEVSAGSILATFATRQKIAEISLNEVDIAGVRQGQKATLTFDAIPGLTITGEVAEIDTIGMTSQGVVTYNVKVAFDTDDARVKPSMTASASIIIQAKTDVLLLPNSAVKSQYSTSYIEMPVGKDLTDAMSASISGILLSSSPERQEITIGLSNDEFTEVTDGLNEGDLVVTRTIQPSSGQTQTQGRQSGLRIPGLTTGGGGMRGSGGFGGSR